MSAKTLGGRVAWSERTAGRGVEGGKVTVGGIEGKQVEGGLSRAMQSPKVRWERAHMMIKTKE